MKAVESLILFVFLIFFAACLEEDLSSPFDNHEPVPQVRVFNNVEEELWPHFESFEDAALDYGYTIDINRFNVVGSIESINNGNVVGTCSYGGRQNHRHVVIDKNFWNRASYLGREYIVFHELGHCILGRGHEDVCLSNGIWSSLMRSGTRQGCRDFYNSNTRDYYVEELFTDENLAP